MRAIINPLPTRCNEEPPAFDAAGDFDHTSRVASLTGVAMPSIDMPLDQMRQYKPSLYREADFDSYWDQTLSAALKQPLNAELIPYPLPVRGAGVYAVRFDGFEGGRIAGFYARPEGNGPFPGICLYHGYSGRGHRPLDLLQYATQGIAALSMDCRGQNGESQDAHIYAGGHQMGWMTSGIRNPRDYYYRYVYADAVRALELLAKRDEVDEKRLAIHGGSQGGGITLAVAALSERPILALPDIPFLCEYRRSVQITGAGPYSEIANFIKVNPHLYEQAFRTLSYCDCLNLASWIQCRTVVSNSLCDNVCPPSSVYAVYNHMSCDKQMEIYPFHLHELPYEHSEIRFRLLIETLKP
jgi:cephalosporin-C deacetylase